MANNNKEHDEVINLVQRFMQDYYQLRARHVRNADIHLQEKTSDVKRNDQEENSPDEVIKQ